jgi:predicted aconitase with swiveling domain
MINLSGAADVVCIDRVILAGSALGHPLVLDEPLSFWGGLNPETGELIDIHHPQHGCNIKDALLFLPGTRGSTAGPGALLEALFQHHGPAAIVLTCPDVATLIAVTAASYIGMPAIPIVEVSGALPRGLREPESVWSLSCVDMQIVRQVSPMQACG